MVYFSNRGTPQDIQKFEDPNNPMPMQVVPPASELYDIEIDRVARKLYWTDADGELIRRANLDGSEIETLIALDPNDPDGMDMGPNDGPRGLALDTVNSVVYWVHSRARKIQRASMMVGATVEDVVTDLNCPRDVALDLDNQVIYWTDPGSEKIQYASLDVGVPIPACEIHDLVVGAGGAFGIDLDVAGARVFWSEPRPTEPRTIRCALISDGIPMDLYDTDVDGPGFLSLDLETRTIYWADGTNRWIARAPMDGSGVVEPILGNLNSPSGIELFSRTSGNVNAGAGEIANVLSINESFGSVSVPTNTDITVKLAIGIQGPALAQYVLWAWFGSTLNPLPLNIGTSSLGTVVNPTPLHFLASPQPFFCLRSSGDARLAILCFDVQELNGPSDAPWSVTKNGGFSNTGEFILQGVLQDNGSASSDGFSMTNAVILKVVP